MSLFTRLRTWGAPAASSATPARPDHVTEALDAERRGDLDGAITSLRLALRDDPTHVDYLQYLGVLYSRAGQVEEAVRMYRRALDHDAALPGAHYGLAFLLLLKGQRDAAARHLTAFLASPDAPDIGDPWLCFAREALHRLRPAAVLTTAI